MVTILVSTAVIFLVAMIVGLLFVPSIGFGTHLRQEGDDDRDYALGTMLVWAGRIGLSAIALALLPAAVQVQGNTPLLSSDIAEVVSGINFCVLLFSAGLYLITACLAPFLGRPAAILACIPAFAGHWLGLTFASIPMLVYV